MADVGVLSLQVEANADQAVNSLEKLAGALSAVKQAVAGGLKLSGISKQLANLGKVVNDSIHGSTFEKIKDLADALQKLSGASFSEKTGQISKMTSALDGVNEVREATDELSTGFATVEQSVMKTADTIENSFEPAKAAIASTMDEFKKMEKEGTFQSWMYGPRPLPNIVNNVGAASMPSEEERMRMNPQWYVNPDSEQWAENVARANARFGEMREKVQEAKSAVQGLSGSIQDLGETGGNQEDMAYVESLVQSATKADLLTMKIESKMAGLAEGVNTGKLNGEQIASQVASIQSMQQELLGLQQESEKTASSISKIGSAFEGIRKNLSSGWFGKLFTKFLSIAKYRALRAILKNITDGIKEGFENYKNYSDKVGNNFSKELKTVNSQFATMKNAVGAALAPALKAALPILSQIISAATSAINVVNQLLSLLTGGSSWSMATGGSGVGATYNAMKGIETASGGFLENLKDTKEEVNEVHKSTKDLLADWDELNIIQSSSSGGGGGGSNLTDALNAFREMEFDVWVRQLGDAINDQFGGLVGLAEQIGAIILSWKLSSLFTGWLSKLFSLVAIGATINFTANFAAVMDRMYVNTGKNGWLIADLLGTAVGSLLAGKLASQIMGTGAGYIAAGITFGFSAGATFAAAGSATGGMRETLDLTGMLKLLIGSALASAGWAALGAGAWSIVGGVMTATIAAAIKYEIDVYAQEKQAAEDAANASFSATGAGGLNPQKYLDEIQKSVDEYTASHKIVIKAYADVPQLEEDLNQSIATITALNAVFKGDSALSEEDAKQFKNAWDSIIETLDKLNSKNYDTILSGLNAALVSANKEIQDNILELRKSFTQLEKNVDGQVAEAYNEMEKLASRIANGETLSDADLERYSKIYHAISESTNESFIALNNAIASGKRLDFGDQEHAVENATQFLENVTSISNEAMKVIDESLIDYTNAVERERAELKAFYDAGLIDMTPEEYNNAMAMYDKLVQALEQGAERDKKSVQQKIQEAYETVFQQAMAGDTGTPEYWNNIMKPLLEQAENAGVEIPEAYVEALRANLSEEFIELPTDVSLEARIKKIEGLDDDTIIQQINEGIYSNLYVGGSLIAAENNSPINVMLDISKGVNLTGFDILTTNLQKGYAQAIRNALGEERGNQILEKMGYNFAIDEMDIPTWFVPKTDEKNIEEFENTVKDEVEEVVKDSVETVEPIDADVPVQFSYDADVSGLSEKAQSMVRSMEAAMELGYDMQQLGEQLNNNIAFFGDQAFFEALPVLQEMMAAYREHLDTSGITEPMQDAADASSEATESIVGDVATLSGQKVGGVDGSALIGSLSALSSSVWSYVNSILNGLSQLGGASVGSYAKRGLRVTAAGHYPAYATGGFPDSGSIFMADENGDIELKGRMGSQPVVANNQQIIAGISEGVTKAQSEQNSLLARQNELLMQILHKSGNAVVTASSQIGRVNARSNRMYERVTGG